MRAVAQQMIGENAGHHGLADRNRADADTRIVPALGDDLDVWPEPVDGVARRQDRAGRFDRKSGDDRLSGRDPAKDSAGMVRS